MQLLETTLLLMALVLLSSVLAHFIRRLPVSLIQVGLGCLAALFLHFETTMDSEWFLLLFVAPLLYNDGRRFPKKELWNLRFPIFANAILLVFVTMLLGGYLIHLIIPTMPLAVGIALAAVLAPTDPVAVHSIAKQVKMPAKIMNTIAGESLINDASGLISFNYAKAAVVTGSIALVDASIDFVYTSLVGAMLGLFCSRLYVVVRQWLFRRGINDVVFNTVLKLAVPFFIYIIVEHVFHASGVIAVVVAGLVVAVSEDRSEAISVMPELRLLAERAWDIVTFVLNGIMFTLLGSVLPLAMGVVIKSSSISTLKALSYVWWMWLIMLLIRVAWTLMMQYLFPDDTSNSSWQYRLYLASVSGIAGVRGAISMAAVFTVPTVIATGQAFPSRTLMQFIAAGVIIWGLVVASLALPFIVGKEAAIVTRGSVNASQATEDDDADETINPKYNYATAKVQLLKQTVKMLLQNRSSKDAVVIDRLIRELQTLIRSTVEVDTDVAQAQRAHVRALRCEVLTRQLNELNRLKKTHQISQRSFRRAKIHLCLVKRMLTKPHQAWLWRLVIIIEQTLRQFVAGMVVFFTSQPLRFKADEWRFCLRDINKVALKYLSQKQKDPNCQYSPEIIWRVKMMYRDSYEKSNNFSPQYTSKMKQQDEQWRLKVTGYQRNHINEMHAANLISSSVAQKLHRYVNHTEEAVFDYDWAMESL